MREMAEKAQILYDQGRYEDALELYHEYLVEYPDDVHALCNVWSHAAVCGVHHSTQLRAVHMHSRFGQ